MYVNKSSDRTVEILEALAETRRPMSHGELAQALSIPKSSLTNILNGLMARRYIVLDAETRRYRLGSRVLVLAKGYLEPLTLVSVATPVLAGVVRAVNESAAVSILDGEEMLVVAQRSCSHPLAHTMTIGSRSPLHSTASGKILLAFTPAPEREVLLKQICLPRVARNTILNRDRLYLEIELVADRGVAISDEEAIDGVYAIGVPILVDGNCAAALSVAAPTSRITDKTRDAIIAALKFGAREAGLQLNGS